MDQRISIVTLGVRDVQASTAFYKRLGWSPSESQSNDDVSFFQMGGVIFGLYGRNALAKDAHVNAPKDGFSGVTFAYNGRTKEEVDSVFAAAIEAGASVLKKPEDVFWGGYSGYFADPDGHAWEVAWNPYFEIKDDGSIILP